MASSCYKHMTSQMHGGQWHSHSTPCFVNHAGRRSLSSALACRAYKLQGQGYKLQGPGLPDAVEIKKPEYVIGSGPACDLQVQGDHVGVQHATIIQKGKQVFCKAMLGEELWDRTYTWLNGQELRPRVSYVLGTNAELKFGETDNLYTVTFEEYKGSNPMMEMILKGVASRASAEVQEQLKKSL